MPFCWSWPEGWKEGETEQGVVDFEIVGWDTCWKHVLEVETKFKQGLSVQGRGLPGGTGGGQNYDDWKQKIPSRH